MKRKDTAKAITDTLDRFVGEIPPADLLILTGGFIAGTQGYTPLTAMLKLAPELDYKVKLMDAKRTAASKLTPEQASGVNAFIDTLGIGAIGNPLGGLIAGWGADQITQQLESMPSYQKSSSSERVAMKEYFVATLSLGLAGMIEAYVITRPGSIAGVGEIIKGIGEIVPG